MERVKRPDGWMPSEFSLAVGELDHRMARGLTITPADVSPLMLEALDERRAVLWEMESRKDRKHERE